MHRFCMAFTFQKIIKLDLEHIELIVIALLQ
jgi:hypothetical protein